MNALGRQEVEPCVDLQLRNLTRTGNKGYHLRSRKGRLFLLCVYVGHNEKNKSHLKNLVKAFSLLGVLGSLRLL